MKGGRVHKYDKCCLNQNSLYNHNIPILNANQITCRKGWIFSSEVKISRIWNEQFHAFLLASSQTSFQRSVESSYGYHVCLCH